MKFALIILATLSTAFCSAQSNLIENGDFEIPDNTPPCLGIFDLNRVPNFWNPINTSPDLYHRCLLNLPFNNTFGYQDVRISGDCYIGIGTYTTEDTSFREYIMCSIKNKLTINKNYLIQFYISNVDYNGYNTNIGCCIEKDSVNGLIQNNFIPTYPEYTFMSDSIIRDCNNWSEISFEFVPYIEDLKYLIIGVFPETKPLKIERNSPTNFCSSPTRIDTSNAYYFIDDIRLYCLDCDTNELCEVVCPDAFTPNNDGLNDSWKPMIQNDCTKNIDNYLLRIFDRWGNIVFTTNNKNKSWSALSNSMGTYVYYLQFDDYHQTQIKQGSLELIK
ncbi:MAG: gliding motility-associated C-terminal domain-containing protein [Bacteroidota bacterium]